MLARFLNTPLLYPSGIYLLKVNDRDTRTREQVVEFVLLSLLLTWNIFHTFF